MQVLAMGREEVLRYLEGDAERRTGRTGAYVLAADDRGGTVLVVAGHAFRRDGGVPAGPPPCAGEGEAPAGESGPQDDRRP